MDLVNQENILDQLGIGHGLFQKGDFELSSGIKSDFRINCEKLTIADLATLAYLVSKRIDYNMVYGVPTGGLRFADSLKRYEKKDGCVLIVDDVLTTGKSITKTRNEVGYWYGLNRKGKRLPIIRGVVIFARGECPDWVLPIFKMW